ARSGPGGAPDLLAADRLVVWLRRNSDRALGSNAELPDGRLPDGSPASGAAASGIGERFARAPGNQAAEPGAFGRAGAHAALCRSGARSGGLSGKQQERSNSGEEVPCVVQKRAEVQNRDRKEA